MKQMLRRITSLGMALLVLVSLLPLQSLATEVDSTPPATTEETTPTESVETVPEEATDTNSEETTPEESNLFQGLRNEEVEFYLLSGKARSIVDKAVKRVYVYTGQTWYDVWYQNKWSGYWEIWGAWWFAEFPYFEFASGAIGYCIQPYNNTAALTATGQSLSSVMSTVLSRLNAFLDSELEQVICFDGGIDAELFASEKSAIFLILPEEDTTKNFVASLMIQNLARELFSVANEYGGKLPNRAVFFCDELGTMPPFDILPLFSAGRSRRLTLVPIIQSLAQLEKNYGEEGAEILQDNCQVTVFGGFAPNSKTAETLSKNMGNRTVLSGQVSHSTENASEMLQMMQRPLMTADELKSMPKGSFVVMKTGSYPMRTRLKLFFEWGIRFDKPLTVEENMLRPVSYASKVELEEAIRKKHPNAKTEMPAPEMTPLEVHLQEQAKKPDGLVTKTDK